MGDPIMNHYSVPHQKGGNFKGLGIRLGHAVPLVKHSLETYLKHAHGNEGGAEAQDYKKFSKYTRKVKRQRKYESSDSDGESSRVINKKKKMSKHKRSKIDEALGDDTY